MEDHELVLISAIVNALAAFGCVVIMLRVTEDFGFCSLLQRVKLCHRVTLAALAIWLFANAGYTLANDSPPRWVDLAPRLCC